MGVSKLLRWSPKVPAKEQWAKSLIPVAFASNH